MCQNWRDIRIINSRYAYRQSRLRIHRQLVHQVGKPRRFDFLHNEIEEVRFVRGMVRKLMCSSAGPEFDSLESDIQRISAMTFDRS
jgi:hypothetical protein